MIVHQSEIYICTLICRRYMYVTHVFLVLTSKPCTAVYKNEGMLLVFLSFFFYSSEMTG